MKRIVSLFICAALICVSLVSLYACGAGGNTAPEGVSGADRPSVPSVLTGGMSEFERAYVTKRGLTLLDRPDGTADVRIYNNVVTPEAIEAMYKRLAAKGFMTEEEARDLLEEAEGYTAAEAMVNGVIYSGFIPPEGYDGGELDYAGLRTFASQDEYYGWLAEYYCPDAGYNASETKSYVEQTKRVFGAVIDGTYTVLPDRYEDFSYPALTVSPFADYRSAWQAGREELEAVSGCTEEYLFYDEQLRTEFLVHVTLPPRYDAERAYPVLFMTDGVWRLGDHAALYKAMEDGEAADVILVSLACNYNVKNDDEYVRYTLFIRNRGLLLDFITDDVMPYLCENYSIDCADSTLFGHSMAGVFSHYALFCSDGSENQPFGRYIIASPALFNLYDDRIDLDPEGAENDYGYFDRHDALDKKVFLCGGALEDPDYESSYNGHDSTLEGLAKIRDRLAAHNADVTYKLYDSHHYQYVSGMLAEYLRSVYPPRQ